MIPRIIHFVWVGSEMPEWAQQNVAAWGAMNGEYRVRVHDQRSLMPELQEAYRATPHMAARSDLIRYSVLMRQGGWYFDVDFWPFRPLDDAVRAWRLDGQRVFISRQQGHKSGNRLPYNNTPLACQPGAHGIRMFIDRCRELVGTQDRVGYGPGMVRDIVDRHPGAFHVGDPGWWFPFSIQQAAEAYHVLMHDPDRIDTTRSGTAGQVPFAAHLWASQVNLESAASKPYDPRPIAAVLDYKNPRQFLHSVAAGLDELGFAVHRISEDPTDLRRMLRRPDVVAGWNGLRDDRWWKAAEDMGCPHLACEHGFFDRGNTFQCDHLGFLHRSSLASALRERRPAPAGSGQRLRRYADPVPVRARSDGYILILGQVDGDTQLRDSEVAGHAPMLRFISRNLPRGIRAVYRPHPQMMLKQFSTKRWPGIDLYETDARAEHKAYGGSKQGSRMADALAGARFCVAVNSNALVEATVAGVPCMAFGPALGLDAGVYHQASTQGRRLARAFDEMLNGWAPDADRVTVYLEWLAARQWTREEIATGRPLADILRRAGVRLPAREAT